jgi:hypothetical protein
MKIVWLVDGVSGDWSRGFESKMASNRYRALIPGAELRRMGHEVDFVSMSRCAAESIDLVGADVVVVAKQFGSQDPARYQFVASRLREALIAAKASGCRVVADFCDDHFDDPLLGPNWRTLASMADTCVVGSDELQKTLRSHTSAAVHVVGDPIASPFGQPRVFRSRSRVQSAIQHWLGGSRASQRLRMVWYGNPVNVAPLFDWAEALAPLANDQAWWLSVVTDPVSHIEKRVAQFNASHGGKAVLESVPWSEDAQWAAVGDADLVLIPSDTSQAAKRAKTANRMTDALHMARFVVASPVPSYAPFSKFTAQTDEPLAAVRHYLRENEETLQRVQAGQAAVIEHASSAKVALAWVQAFRLHRKPTGKANAVTPASLATAPSESPTIRLNLGCGDKILDGYINVDVVKSRAGKSPDVICDLHQLTPFPDNHADEILAVHVVEHFWRWEVEAILREWIRVLKPGGRMVLECPNLAAACEAFLANPESGSMPDAAGQRTMWVFYGDPRWKDPLMVHRWGYTPKSLVSLLEQSGLVNARQEPAQYKLKEPRDMRVVAEKTF